ncbi:MAG TPA: tannase/feruloyl esterase family alpha/beta hydrolase, partial [Gemmatimonadaceae bacterium]|nr:tannase/feruloyl esterase family alpha/beta hydrolase [Gemmatimonadaceae bacterium]
RAWAAAVRDHQVVVALLVPAAMRMVLDARVPRECLEFLSSLGRRMGGDTVRGFMQLYLLPGMGHCGSGEEPNDFGQWLRPGDTPRTSLYSALEQWVEKGVAPDGVIATKFAVDGNPRSAVLKRRLICPYPRVATWSQNGSRNDPTTYSCPL